jgi:hypothetical protein
MSMSKKSKKPLKVPQHKYGGTIGTKPVKKKKV